VPQIKAPLVQHIASLPLVNIGMTKEMSRKAFLEDVLTVQASKKLSFMIFRTDRFALTFQHVDEALTGV